MTRVTGARFPAFARPAAALAAALLAAPAVEAAGGDQLWRFYADFSVTVVQGIPDLSGNGGMDMLVGSGDDTLYLVEGRGDGKGAPLWASPFRSTLSAAAALPDVSGDGKPDALGGDELGFIQAVNGATGASIWRYLTFGTVLGAVALPDVNGDNVPDVAVGSENDTLYCFSGKASSLLGEVIWQFGAPVKSRGGPADKVAAAAGKPKDAVTGVNSVAALKKGEALHGIVAGVSNDTVYCFPPGGGIARWKAPMPGDAWQVAAFPDQDGDGIEEVLVACGADIGYLLKGSDGSVLWSRPVSLGAVSVAAAGDMTGDGKPDALIGDGGGKLHCVPGNASGTGAAAAWTYDFRDTSTIHSIAALGDVDGDGRADCAVGTSHDRVALVSGQGTLTWSVDMGGTVFSVTSLGDLDGNGSDDVGAGTETGFAAAYRGNGGAAVSLRRDSHGIAVRRAWTRRAGLGIAFGLRDLKGRILPVLPGKEAGAASAGKGLHGR